jgi:hypothetical protein
MFDFENLYQFGKEFFAHANKPVLRPLALGVNEIHVPS